MTAVKVRVLQQDGEIRLSTNGGPTQLYEVHDGHIEVEPEELAGVLSAVHGAEVELKSTSKKD